MSQQYESESKAVLMQRGGVIFAAGMALAAASIVVEFAIIRFFGK